MVYIYMLELAQGKYYVGKTTNIDARLKEHYGVKGYNPQASAWTTKYKPIKTLQIIPNCDAYDEDKYTVQLMEKYGGKIWHR